MSRGIYRGAVLIQGGRTVPAATGSADPSRCWLKL
jgi:hypothetical protein